MGGNAAKERRKLKRLAESTTTVTTPTTAATTESAKENDYQKKRKEGSNGGGGNFNRGNNDDGQQQQQQQYKRQKQIGSNGGGNQNYNNTKKYPTKSNHKIPIKASSTIKKKVKKPKHLARKLKSTSDPEVLRQLTKQQSNHIKHKSERKNKFKLKVVELVGGKQFFNETMFDLLMEKGGGKIETIVEAVKVEPAGQEKGQEQQVQQDRKEKLRQQSYEDDYDDDPGAGMVVVGQGGIPIESANISTDSEMVPEVEVEAVPVVKANVARQKKEKEDTSEDNESNTKEKDTTTANVQEEKNNDKNNNDGGDDDSSSSSDSENEEELTIPAERTRGRRRRGRQDEDAKREEQNQDKKELLQKEKEAEEKAKADEIEAKKNTKRRCLGRKPLTDFQIGKQYTGSIVYIKPKLGLFIDIGCHSDAFCHISRSADEFVDTITDDIFKVGDVLEGKVRVVNIDRRKKKITVSLQSDEKIKDEEKSNNIWKERQAKKNAKKEQLRKEAAAASSNQNDYSNGNSSTYGTEETPISAISTTPLKEHVHEEVPIIIDPDNMTPAELKRARKLQRRAERRQQQEGTTTI